MALSFSQANRTPRTAAGAGVTAVLGPTNTGKTHLAIERMLAHSSGIIGLPLRLLAREVYNKMVDRVGAESVALVTGEEKIKPPHARYWVSTVEAMPRDLDVAFVAIDEVQLAADLERGHVFTDRMLNRRGRDETLVLGAQTVRPMVEKLLPAAHILSRPRLSQLVHVGDRKITRLPRRSAIVAFSAGEVYAIAELIRRQRGGAAVVLGSLSPRTRNAQVALFQAGEVDHLVATDAIGMGLNLDVDHVAFASDRKYDGYQYRRLNPAEMAQIAGRAGRATRDGTFGTTGRCDPFEPELVQALEAHSFEPIRIMQWRNSALDMRSLGALQASLAMVPSEPGLTRAPVGEDILVLEHAMRDEEVRALASAPAAVERLWDVCQIPDFRKISPAAHAELVITLYGFLTRKGSLPTDWFAGQIALADRTDGDIDTLSNRIAHIRTWTFAANRPDWLADPEHWQAIARGIEDKLSDALHEQLLHRFVDRRTSVLMRRLRENTMLETEISKTGDVLVEGHLLGRLEGFRFAADASAAGSEAKALRSAAQKALGGEINARSARLAAAGDEQFVLASDGTLRWLGDAVGKLTAGDAVLRPQIRLIADEQLTGASREAVQARLDLWIKAHIEKLLGPLVTLANAEDVTGMARGIAFQLTEALGVIERQKVSDDVKGLDQDARSSLRKYGVRFGAYHLYLPGLLKPAPRLLALQLWALKQDGETKGIDELPQLAASGRTSMPLDKDVPKALYRTIGYRVSGERAVRVDILERLADLIRPALAWRPGSAAPKPPGAVDGSSFAITGGMTSLVGASAEDFASVLRSLGYRMERRPKPADVPPAPVPAEPAASTGETAPPMVEAEAASPAVLGTGPVTPEAVAEAADSVEPTTDAAMAPAQEAVADTIETSGEQDVVADAAPASAAETVMPQPALEPHAIEAAANGEITPEPPLEAGAPPETSPTDAPPPHATAAEGEGTEASTQASTEPAAAVEPEMIEVWRPGRFEERRGPRPARPSARPRAGDREGHRDGQRDGARPHGRRPARGTPAPQPQAADAPAEVAAATQASAEAAPGAGNERQRHQRPPQRDHQRPRDNNRENRGPRRPFDHGAGGDRPPGFKKGGERPRTFGKGDERSRKFDKADQSYATSAPRERRDKQPDPNSPFAKLQALKEQLEANVKERR